jgi:hypothetical protein
VSLDVYIYLILSIVRVYINISQYKLYIIDAHEMPFMLIGCKVTKHNFVPKSTVCPNFSCKDEICISDHNVYRTFHFMRNLTFTKHIFFQIPNITINFFLIQMFSIIHILFKYLHQNSINTGSNNFDLYTTNLR